MKKLIVLTFCLLIQIISYSQNESTEQYCKGIEIFVRDSINNEFYYSKRSIPEILKKSIKKYFDSDFYIANPSKKYNKTDVIRNPILPNKQMLFLIQNQNKYALIYRRGGRCLQTYFIFAEIESSEVVLFKVFNINNSICTVDDFLDQVVSQKKYRENKENIKEF
jgi:hypothetical protein